MQDEEVDMDILDHIKQRAKQDPKRIVFAEGDEERTLRAIAEVIKEKTAVPIILGDPTVVRKKIDALHLHITYVDIVNPVAHPKLEAYAQCLADLRKHRGLNIDAARKLLINPIYFGTMMVKQGDADGMVAGAVHTTAETILPALQVIKTKEKFHRVSGLFLMELNDNNYLFADCAVNIEPDAETLAEIALDSAKTARELGIDPTIAMLSFSTHGSAEHGALSKIEEAVKIVKKRNPSIIIDGELQVDAALVPEVCKLKASDSPVQGKATVLIFPDLSSANIAYKLVERLGHAKAVGPILQGLALPVNDLSRGCSPDDIVDITAVTVMQAQDIAKEGSSNK